MVTKKEQEYVSESDNEAEPEPVKKQPVPKVSQNQELLNAGTYVLYLHTIINKKNSP